MNKITLEPHVPTFLHSEYALLGLIGRIFNLNSVLTYHLSRLVLGAIFLLVAFYFFYFLFKTYGWRPTGPVLLAFFLSFYIGGFPDLSSVFPFPSSVSSYLNWWVELDVTRRSTILPHYLMGNILFLLVLIFFLSYPSRTTHLTRLKKLFFLFLFSFLLSFVHPIDYLILLATLFLYLVLDTLLKFKIKNSLKISNFKLKIYPLLTVVAGGIIPFLYIRYALTLPFWRFILAHGTTTKYHIPIFDFIMSLGPVFFLAIGGILVSAGGGRQTRPSFLHFFAKNSWRVAPDRTRATGTPPAGPVLLMFSWLIVQAAFFLKLYEVFNFDRLRTMQPPYYIPLAFFTTLFLNRLPRIIFIIVITIIIFISFPVSFVSLKNQIFEVSDFKSFSSFTYPSKKQYEAWEFLRKNTSYNSAITALYEARFLIPAVSGNKIAFGANFENDPYFEKNLSFLNQLYSSSPTPLTSRIFLKFLKANRISFVYQGFQEKSLGADLSKYPFLQKIFDNGEVAIFVVK